MYQRDKHIFQIKLDNGAAVQVSEAENPNKQLMVAHVLFYLTSAGCGKVVLGAAKKAFIGFALLPSICSSKNA